MTFVMLSHDTRVGARLRSLDELAGVTCAPIHIVESTYRGETPDAEVRARAYDALRLAEGGGLVFLEDDLAVNAPLFRRHLDMAVASQVVTAFCAVNRRHYPPGTLEKDRLPIGLEPIPSYDADRGFHGSMAVYLPPAMVAHGLQRREEFQEAHGGPLERPVIPPDFLRRKVTGFDFWIKHTARAFGGMYVALPNSVDHDDRGSVHRPRPSPWRSPSYGIPTA